MDGYNVESASLKEVRKLINKGEWKKSKVILKDLLKNEIKFASLCQIDKCFVTRFLGERYKHERKFNEAIQMHTIYSNVAKGLPVEEQRAFATLGSTYQDSAILGEFASHEDKLKVLEKAEFFTMKAVKAAKGLLMDCLSSTSTITGVGRIEAGHMMSRGLYNLALIELSHGQSSSQAKAISCLEKALRVIKDYVVATVSKQSATATAGSDVEAFQLNLYEELAALYRAVHRLADLWQLATDGISLAEKLLVNANDGRSRVKARREIATFLMHKAHASLGECHFDIAVRLANEALKMLASSSSTNNKPSSFGGSKMKRRRVANEYAPDFDDEDDNEDATNTDGMSKEITHFKQTCTKLAKLSKKVIRLQKVSPVSPECSKHLEKIADLLFDEGVFQQAKVFYEKSLSGITPDNENSQVGVIVSIGRCLLSLGGGDFEQFVTLTLKSSNFLQSSHKNKILIGLYEIAVDYHIENLDLTHFAKYLRLEMDVRRIDDGDGRNSLCRRLAEISKKIDDNKEGGYEKQLKETFTDLLDELFINKDDVAVAMVQLEDEGGGSTSVVSSVSCELSSSESSTENDTEDDDKPKGCNNKAKSVFMPIRIKRNEKGETKLHVACVNANVANAEKLLKAGHPLNVCDGSGYFPIHDAADSGCPAMVTLLLAHGADANAVNEQNGLTPSMEAAVNAHLPQYRAVLRVLLERGNVNWDVKNNRAQTALHFLWQNRRENEQLMSPEDLADWMEIESLILAKMRKRPQQQQQQQQTQLTQSANIHSTSLRDNRTANRNRVVSTSSSSSSSSDSEDVPTLPNVGRKDGNDDAVHLYQSAIGGIGRSAKSGKRKVVDGDSDEDGETKSRNADDKRKKQKRSDALKTIVAENPFSDAYEVANDEASWLVDDTGIAAKKQQNRSAVSTKRQQVKRAKAMNALENVAEAQAQLGDEDQLVAAVLAASDKDNENVDQLLLSMLSGDDEGQKQVVTSLPRNNSMSLSFSSASTSSKADRNDNSELVVNLPEADSPSPIISVPTRQLSFCSNKKVVNAETVNGDGNFLTIRVHLEREDPSAIGGRRRDSLLINNIPDNGDQWDIKRLRHETKVRYAALFGQSPVISSMRLLDGTTLADDSRLAPIAQQHGELMAIIEKWDLPPLLDRYEVAASLLLSASSPGPTLANALSQAEQSGRLDIRDLLLSNSQLHCVFKALLHQTNINSLYLSGNRFGSGSTAGSSSLLATAKAFADMVATLPNLIELDLSLANLSGGDLEQITQTLTQSTNNKTRLRRLNLSFNSFCPSSFLTDVHGRGLGTNNHAAESLSALLRFFSSSLRRLSLVSCDLDGEALLAASHNRLLITEAFKSLRELNELDLSHNRRLSLSGGLDYLLTHALSFDQLTILRLNDVFPYSTNISDNTGQSSSFGRVVAHILANCNRLIELSLSSNGQVLDDDQVIELANNLERARCLTRLDLSANVKLGSRAFLELARILPRCHLVRLDLSSTGITSPLDLTIFNCLADKMDSESSPLVELALPSEYNFTASDLSSLHQLDFISSDIMFAAGPNFTLALRHSVSNCSSILDPLEDIRKLGYIESEWNSQITKLILDDAFVELESFFGTGDEKKKWTKLRWFRKRRHAKALFCDLVKRQRRSFLSFEVSGISDKLISQRTKQDVSLNTFRLFALQFLNANSVNVTTSGVESESAENVDMFRQSLLSTVLLLIDRFSIDGSCVVCPSNIADQVQSSQRLANFIRMCNSSNSAALRRLLVGSFGQLLEQISDPENHQQLHRVIHTLTLLFLPSAAECSSPTSSLVPLYDADSFVLQPLRSVANLLLNLDPFGLSLPSFTWACQVILQNWLELPLDNSTTTAAQTEMLLLRSLKWLHLSLVTLLTIQPSSPTSEAATQHIISFVSNVFVFPNVRPLSDSNRPLLAEERTARKLSFESILSQLVSSLRQLLPLPSLTANRLLAPFRQFSSRCHLVAKIVPLSASSNAALLHPIGQCLLCLIVVLSVPAHSLCPAIIDSLMGSEVPQASSRFLAVFEATDIIMKIVSKSGRMILKEGNYLLAGINDRRYELRMFLRTLAGHYMGNDIAEEGAAKSTAPFEKSLYKQIDNILSIDE